MSIDIYFNATPLLSPRTGIGQYCLNLMSELNAMPGVASHFFYGANWSREILKEPLSHVTTAKKAKRFIGQLMPNLAYELQQQWRGLNFRAGIQPTRPAIYHEPNFLPLRTSLPTVVTIHDLSILRYPETHPRDRVAFMSKRINSAIKRADCVITDAEYVRQEILAEFCVAPERVVSVPLAASHLYCPVAPEVLQSILKEYNLHANQYILAVGTLEPRKNLLTAFRAYARLSESIRKSMPFVVVGMKGWRSEGIDREIESLVSKDQLRRLGYVPDHVLPALYSGASVFVYPSLYEGFGLPPLEAMACGAPVIVSDRSTLPEVVGNAGILVDAMDVDNLAQAMTTIIESEEIRNRMKRQGIERAATFSWRRCAEQTLNVYKQVVGQ